MCDLAVAADTARFALPGVNVGVFCSTPAVGVARNIARKRAMEMLLTGEPIDARDRARRGASSIASCRPAELDAAVGRSPTGSSRESASVIALGKRAFYAPDRPAARRRVRGHVRGDGLQPGRSAMRPRASTRSSKSAAATLEPARMKRLAIRIANAIGRSG